MNLTPSVFIYTALSCEASPMVNYFRLKKRTDIQPFTVYCNEDVCLTITGVGKTAMAAGVAYTQALFPSIAPIMINTGIAGHPSFALGSLFIADKIIDADTQKAHYPALVYPHSQATGTLVTHTKPQLNYHQNNLFDMEASAFFDTALRFSSSELTQCIKIISDNKESQAEQITPAKATQLIEPHKETIAQIITAIKRLRSVLSTVDNDDINKWAQLCHFTVSEQRQLKALLARWAILSEDHPQYPKDAPKNSTSILQWLKRQIEGMPFTL